MTYNVFSGTTQSSSSSSSSGFKLDTAYDSSALCWSQTTGGQKINVNTPYDEQPAVLGDVLGLFFLFFFSDSDSDTFSLLFHVYWTACGVK